MIRVVAEAGSVELPEFAVATDKECAVGDSGGAEDGVV
jgi:hypothetical protein